MAEYKENYPRGQQDCCLADLGTEDVVAENYQQQVEMLEGYTEMDALADHGFFPGISKETREKIARSERMAIRISNVANMVHFAAKVYASVRSGSLAIIASTLDSLLDLLSGFILWFTAFSLQTPNPDQYPIGKKLMQPLAIFALGVARHASPPWRQDNKDGHYTFVIGENLTPRYRILSKLGEGTFGQVLECWDVEKKEAVAIKVASSAQNCRKAAKFEIDVLQKLAKHDLGGSRCVQMRNWFGYRNHICIVFEKLGPNLYDFVRKNTYRSFPIDLVRELGRQLLESVACMHDLRLIHTDLKPENILLVSSEYVQIPDYKEGSYFKNLPKSSAIKLIDFGSTEFEHQDNTYLVTTRNYRAPEVILGMGWNCPCDLWSVGCILFELCSGKALFQPLKTLEHLAMMERVLGRLPQHMVRRAYRRSKKYYFRRGLRLNWPQSSKYYLRRRLRLDWPQSATSREGMRAVYKLRCLPILVMQHVDHSAGDLINLLQGLLRYDPNERLKAREALGHPFFTRELRSSGCTM